MNIPVVFEDETLLILNKPSGVTVNRAETTRNQITVQDFLDTYLTFDKSLNTDFVNRSGIVHRLDKETSGILIVAKTEQAFISLQSQFKERLVQKVYIALSHGKVDPKEGEIKAPVGRLPWNRKRFGILAGGRESVTYYKVVKEFTFEKIKEKNLTLLELYPKTGRTHQIRVHLKYINRPIFGDELYSGRKTSREDRRFLSRVFLHAQKITFNHPELGQQVSFEAPLPPELKEFLDCLSS